MLLTMAGRKCQPQRMSITRVLHNVNIKGPLGSSEFGQGGKITGKLADFH
jgi:hypothetical protein